MMDWLDEIEARANLVVKNHEDWSVAAAVTLAGRDVPALLAEVERLKETLDMATTGRDHAEDLAVILRAELEAAKQDIRDMLRADCSEEHCEKCKTHKKGLVCMIGNCDNAEWRGVTENGGANE